MTFKDEKLQFLHKSKSIHVDSLNLPELVAEAIHSEHKKTKLRPDLDCRQFKQAIGENNLWDVKDWTRAKEIMDEIPSWTNR